MDRNARRQQALERINQAFADGAVPHNKELGLRALEVRRGEVVLELPPSPLLVGNPDTGALHGGAVFSLIDATCGMAVWLALEAPTRIATLDLRVDYLKPAPGGEPIRARATCFKVTRHVAFVRAMAFAGGAEQEPVASASATFMVFGGERSPLAEKMRQREESES